MELDKQFINLKSADAQVMQRQKGNKNLQLARVSVEYYNLLIYGYLLRGESAKGFYYYFEMPNIFIKGKHNQRDRVLNRVKFENKENSDFFQSVVLSKLKVSHPEFFEAGYGKE